MLVASAAQGVHARQDCGKIAFEISIPAVPACASIVIGRARSSPSKEATMRCPFFVARLFRAAIVLAIVGLTFATGIASAQATLVPLKLYYSDQRGDNSTT